MYESEYYGSMEQLFWEAAFCYCLECGSSAKTIVDDALYLGIEDPVCCGVPEPLEDGDPHPDVQTCMELERNGEYWGHEVTV